MSESKILPTPSPGAGDESETLSRRTLVRAGVCALGAGYVGALGYPVYRYLAAPIRQAAAAGQITEVTLPASDLPEPGAAMFFKFGTRPALLIHHGDGSLSCFDAVCTHLACTVQFEPAQQRIFCACHGGVYDMHTGDVVAGPPPRGLTTYRIEVHDESVVVSRA